MESKDSLKGQVFLVEGIGKVFAHKRATNCQKSSSY